MNLNTAIKMINPLDKSVMTKAKKKFDLLAKPQGSLGKLEDIVIQLAGIFKNSSPKINKKIIIVMCSDNGVVNEGVTSSSQKVTAGVANLIADGQSSVCALSKISGADVIAVDIGMNSSLYSKNIIKNKIAYGTNNFVNGSAMTKIQTIAAIECGIDTVRMAKEKGFNIIGTGEMGIGNTTTSSAIASVLFDLPVSEVVGRGAGLSDSGLERKITAVKKAININNPQKDNPIDLLSKLGGLDIAGMTGCFIGAAAFGLPVVIDGLISSVAAYLAYMIAPESINYMIASHLTAEPAGKIILDKIQKSPLINCDMCLGEGTGCAILFSLIDHALSAYYNTAELKDICI